MQTVKLRQQTLEILESLIFLDCIAAWPFLSTAGILGLHLWPAFPLLHHTCWEVMSTYSLEPPGGCWGAGDSFRSQKEGVFGILHEEDLCMCVGEMQCSLGCVSDLAHTIH